MKRTAASSLWALVRGAVPLFRLPTGVMRQLVGYYGDWRQSRDIMNDVIEEGAYRERIPRSTVITHTTHSLGAR